MTSNKSIGPQGSSQKILLIGDISKVFLDTVSITNSYEVSDNVSDALDTLSKDSFTAIGVVMCGMSKLEFALKGLRDTCNTKIILLAQMYEEPVAMKLVGSTFNGASLADEYFICPIEAKKFYESIISPQGRIEKGAISSIGFNATIENKIRILEKLATEMI